MHIRHTNADPTLVLNKAIVNAAQYLSIKQNELSKIIGISTSSLSRLFNDGSPCIRVNTKEWECAVLFLRIIRSLDIQLGKHPDQAREWLYNDNQYLANKPIEMIKTIPGLNEVVIYLDAIQSRGEHGELEVRRQ